MTTPDYTYFNSLGLISFMTARLPELTVEKNGLTAQKTALNTEKNGVLFNIEKVSKGYYDFYQALAVAYEAERKYLDGKYVQTSETVSDYAMGLTPYATTPPSAWSDVEKGGSGYFVIGSPDVNILYPEDWLETYPKKVDGLKGGTGTFADNEQGLVASEVSLIPTILAYDPPPWSTARYYSSEGGALRTALLAHQTALQAEQAALVSNPDYIASLPSAVLAYANATTMLGTVQALIALLFFPPTGGVSGGPLNWTNTILNDYKALAITRGSYLTTRLAEVVALVGDIDTTGYYKEKYFWLDKRVNLLYGSLTDYYSSTVSVDGMTQKITNTTDLETAYDIIV